MRAILNNIIHSYQMQGEALSVLLENTQRALKLAEKIEPVEELAQDIDEDSPAPAQDTYDYELEDAFECPNMKSVGGDEENSKCPVDSRV